MFSLIPMACSLLLAVLAPVFQKRTEKGLRWQGQILGLRRFMERAEKSRLEALVAENPDYFYSVLPYAYVLGVSDAWARKFENMIIEPPRWYHGRTYGAAFSAAAFTTALSHHMNQTQASLTSTHTSSGSGGRGGGGGFSGGGFGGRGGGSW